MRLFNNIPLKSLLHSAYLPVTLRLWVIFGNRLIYKYNESGKATESTLCHPIEQ